MEAERRLLFQANTGFYNSLGFETVATTVAGNDNPTWTENPVVVSIVSGTRAVVTWTDTDCIILVDGKGVQRNTSCPYLAIVNHSFICHCTSISSFASIPLPD